MKKIFFVEDDKEIISIYRTTFTDQGFQFECAEDGLAAVKMLPLVKPDILVLDLMLPKLNGVDVLKFVRSHAELQETPVIIFSNAFMSDMAQRAAIEGANIGLLKSACAPQKLVEVVNHLLYGTVVDTGNIALLAAPVVGSKTPSPENGRSAAHGSPRPPSPSGTSRKDADFMGEIRQVFFKNAASNLTAIRKLWSIFLDNEGSTAQPAAMTELRRKLHSLSSNSGIVGCLYISQFTSALEILLEEIEKRSDQPRATRLLTVSAAIDFLGFLIERTADPAIGNPAPANILVVDDDIDLANALVAELQKANFKTVGATNSPAALKLLESNRYDLILLEANLPEISGYKFCAQLRAMSAHEKTPIIFVAATTDFDSHARCELSGGNDTIAKPFLFIELTVKALIQIMRGQILAAKPQKKR